MTTRPKPEFVDNRYGNTLATALNDLMAEVRSTRREPLSLSIATGYFNLAGFAILADELKQLESVRILLGAAPLPDPPPRRTPGDPPEAAFRQLQVEQGLRDLSEGMKTDINLIGFSQVEDEQVKSLVGFLENSSVQVRRYNKGFMHGKAFILSDHEGFLAGSSNLTGAGLTSNMELNLGRYDPTPNTQITNWFEDLWSESEPFNLAEFYQNRFAEYDPYLIYLRALWERYKDELEEEQSQSNGSLHLTSFQNDGIFRAKKILKKYNGVIIADGVGLGKTFIGGALIEETIRKHRQRVLLICPAALRDGTWNTFALNNSLPRFEVMSYEQFAEEEFHFDPEDYSLVVIDEAQAFRNTNTRREQTLRKLLRGFPPKKLVLMTATPVNNSLWDMYNLLSYFIKQDSRFMDVGIRSLREYFRGLQAVDPMSLNPEQLFDVLDAVVVRRTRNFIKTYYPLDTIRGSDGDELVIQFPRSSVNRLTYDIDVILPGLLEDFEREVMPEVGEPNLTMARYSTELYLRLPDQSARNMPAPNRSGLVALMRSNLLKRLESSPFAFSETLRKMIRGNDTFLSALENKRILTTVEINQYFATDDDSFEESLENLLDTDESDISNYDIDRLARDVKLDNQILSGFLQKSEKVTIETDTKLAAIADTLRDILSNAVHNPLPIESQNKRKVVIFSYFADTVDWITDYLESVVQKDPGLQGYQGRIVSVSGDQVRNAASRTEAVFGFVPISAEAPSNQENKFDILITTDALSEGQNLQQAAHVINADLPWNPMRLVQRHGRIDRIGSQHDEIFLHCIFPDSNLDRLLNLEARIQNKIAQAAASIGVESEIMPGSAVSTHTFSDSEDKIRSIYAEDSSLFETGGENSAAQSGEAYRQELRKALQVRGSEIRNLPWGVGSGFKSDGQKGIFFCARVGDIPYFRFVDSETNEISADTLLSLRAISCTAETSQELGAIEKSQIYEAWQSARAHIYDEWQLNTDPANLQPRIRPIFLRAGNHLREFRPDALTQDMWESYIDAIETDWRQNGIEIRLRTILGDDESNPYSKSQQIIDMIDELGLEASQPPEPFDPLYSEEEIHIICWLVVS